MSSSCSLDYRFVQSNHQSSCWDFGDRETSWERFRYVGPTDTFHPHDDYVKDKCTRKCKFVPSATCSYVRLGVEREQMDTNLVLGMHQRALLRLHCVIRALRKHLDSIGMSDVAVLYVCGSDHARFCSGDSRKGSLWSFQERASPSTKRVTFTVYALESKEMKTTDISVHWYERFSEWNLFRWINWIDCFMISKWVIENKFPFSTCITHGLPSSSRVPPSSTVPSSAMSLATSNRCFTLPESREQHVFFFSQDNSIASSGTFAIPLASIQKNTGNEEPVRTHWTSVSRTIFVYCILTRGRSSFLVWLNSFKSKLVSRPRDVDENPNVLDTSAWRASRGLGFALENTIDAPRHSAAAWDEVYQRVNLR